MPAAGATLGSQQQGREGVPGCEDLIRMPGVFYRLVSMPSGYLLSRAGVTGGEDGTVGGGLTWLFGAVGLIPSAPADSLGEWLGTSVSP